MYKREDDKHAFAERGVGLGEGSFKADLTVGDNEALGIAADLFQVGLDFLLFPSPPIN